MSELSVSGRNIAPASLVAAAELFRTFAWVQTVTARCYEGAVDISVRAMAAAEWSASLRNDLPRPSERTRQLRIGPDGSVSIP